MSGPIQIAYILGFPIFQYESQITAVGFKIPRIFETDSLSNYSRQFGNSQEILKLTTCFVDSCNLDCVHIVSHPSEIKDSCCQFQNALGILKLTAVI